MRDEQTLRRGQCVFRTHRKIAALGLPGTDRLDRAVTVAIGDHPAGMLATVIRESAARDLGQMLGIMPCLGQKCSVRCGHDHGRGERAT
ncbi:Uncharacterised protein [Mycobacteroides abscessus subsp. abscessus]|nr:Uncharacterised protein [Mycobacteroides abscessus subsp. abscessus]